MSPRAARILLSILAVVAVGAAFASISSAAVWKFDGKSLEGEETVVGSATLNITVFGLNAACESTLQMTIRNVSGQARGEVTKLTFSNCSTGSKVCVVETIGAEKLPWPVKGVTISTKSYLVVSEVRVGVSYGEEGCPLYEIPLTITGTAGGFFDNSSATLAFDPTTFTATATELKVAGTSVEWKGAFPIKATGPHSGETLTL